MNLQRKTGLVAFTIHNFELPENCGQLDPVGVFLEDVDEAGNVGYLTLTCYGQAWTAYWGGMGHKGLRRFLLSVNDDYIVNNLVRGMDMILKFQRPRARAYLLRIVGAMRAALERMDAEETP